MHHAVGSADMDLIADEDTLDLGKEYGTDIAIEYEVPAPNDPELEDKRLDMDIKNGLVHNGRSPV